MVAERRSPIQIGEGVRRVLKYSLHKTSEQVAIEKSLYRILAEDLIADHDVPPFNRSPYDGFALKAEDTENASQQHPIFLKVIDEIGAGEVSTATVDRGEAVRIMTGAAIPEGANAVAMFEVVKEQEQDGNQTIEVGRRFSKGQNISRRGEDTSEGTRLLKKGTTITPGVIALLATFGYKYVSVYEKPRVGIFATGTELLDIDEPLQSGKIRNSNAYMIASQVEKMGGEPVYFGKLKDDFEACFVAVTKSLSEVDVLITTGGVSVGDYDYLPAIYKKLGANVLFNKLAMRPGSVTTVAEYNGKLLFGLSGNPSACFVGGELFVRPFLKQSYGDLPYLAKTKAVLQTDFPKANPFTRLVRSRVEFTTNGIEVQPTGLDKSSSVTSIAEANAFIMFPGGTRSFEKGATVDVLLFDQQSGINPWNE
ncbi:gephyrin-like molybdotransferase Glp [Alkalihalobacillus sp. AL-G]|uniref:molybdopterin molybdotransferase MoeA n=1 Tax=Alkalihalobacillus sp. AL-G TaxID=2926399 RepID=UPI00272D0332|nr:gephyrin-like molybdotransferase Glp [Alkalihalobacillus sp. AL-G]WLD94890.1 molybdopterin molybdotransferase MoeA [Alkalihalobacillus sp. AL-G]